MADQRHNVNSKSPPLPLAKSPPLAPRKRVPELYQLVVECRDEGQQREIYERLRAEGVRVRLHVL